MTYNDMSPKVTMLNQLRLAFHVNLNKPVGMTGMVFSEFNTSGKENMKHTNPKRLFYGVA